MLKIAAGCVLFMLLYSTNVQCLSKELLDLGMMLHDMCREETGVSEESIERAIKGNFLEDYALKCYLKCLMVQLAMMDDDGYVDVETVVGLLPEDIAEVSGAVVRSCGTQAGNDSCDRAFQTHKCYYEGAPQNYILL